MGQRPKQPETHSSAFPQDSDSDSESEIELRSTHTSPETTTSDESDGTLVDTSTSPTPTQSLSGEGDLDSTEGHSQLLVGTLPLIGKDPPESPEDKNPPPNPSVEGLASGFSEDNTGNLSRDKRLTTTHSSEELKQVANTPPLPQREESPSEYPPQDQPETPLDSGEGLEISSYKKSQKVPTDDPFSRFWSGETADISDKDKRRDGWLNRKPERRHLVELEALDEQDQRSFKYVLKRERDLLPRPRFYSKSPDARSISLEHAEFILRHIVQHRHQELQQEELEREKRESERRRQSELPTDITGKPKRLIPVDPIIFPFDNGEDKVPGEETYINYRSPEHPPSPDQDPDPDLREIPLTSPVRTPIPTEGPEPPGSPLTPRLPIPHQESTSLEDSIDSETDPIMTATTKELIDTLTKTLKNINQSPTIPLPVFKGKKGEDPEDHILKVEGYFGVHQIIEQSDKINRFKDTLFKTSRKWAQTLNYAEVKKFDYDPENADDKKASMKYLFLTRFAKEGRTLEAVYSVWGVLTFDPNKDDIEQFILKVEELAKK